MEEEIELALDPVTQLVTVNDPDPTVSVLFDRAAQQAVIDTAPGPTIGSRVSAITHTAMFDAWSQFDPLAEGTELGRALAETAAGSVDAGTIDSGKTVAMAYAAFTALTDLYPDREEAFFEVLIEAVGLDPRVTFFAEDDPFLVWADIGRQAGEAVVAARAEDGANQAGDYADTSGYAPVNAGPNDIVDIARWTPENVPIDPEDDAVEQSFLTPHWGDVEPFALPTGDYFRPEAPEPFFAEGVSGTLDIEAGTITLADGTLLVVTADLVGPVINPGFVAQAEALVSASATLTDEQKLIAEFWEDGGGTSFPPGTWMTFGQFVSARDANSVDDDAKLFFALSNAVFDAGIATWEAKVFYDYARPVRAVRELGDLGLIGETGTDALTGEEGFVIDAWAGPGLGTQTILAENFLTYQTPDGDASPPFAEYTSGHSAFSAAAAEVLQFYAGDEFDASVTFAPGSSRFEPGVTPTEPLTLAWDTFTEAADEGGISRIYGAIHFDDGDLNGRQLGRDVGRTAFTEAERYINGVAGEAPDSTTATADVLEVGRLYLAMLGRFPDQEGFNFWVDVFEAGLSDEALASFFLEALEVGDNFQTTDLDDPAAFVGHLFQNAVLDADATDLDETLISRLEGGESNGAILADFVEEEAVADSFAWLNGLQEVEPGVWWFA